MVGQSVSLNSLTFSVVGPGKVGASLAHWLEVQGGRLKLVGHRSRGPAQDLVRGLGGRPIPIGEISTVEEDLCLIAVPDESLGDVAALLAERPQAGVVLHTSGRAPAEILAPLRRTGSAIGSFHPLKAFPQVIADPREARSLVFGIDGDEKALLLARRLASALSASACEIPAAVRSHYHLAATMAAGGLVTLLAVLRSWLRGSGLATKWWLAT